MSKKIGLFLLCIATYQQTWCLKTAFSLGVGPAWNQVVAVEHYTLNNQNDVQAKSIVTGLDNPCAAIAGNLAFTYCDKYYLQLFFYDIAGNKGFVLFDQEVQEGPFNRLSNLDGRLSTHVFEVGLVNGINWPVTDRVGLTLAGGYLYYLADRPVCFIRDRFNFRVHDIFNGGVVKFGPTLNLNDKLGISVFYLFGIGKLRSQIRAFNPDATTMYTFPWYMNNIVAIDASYKVSECVKASVAAVWYVAQNTKNGRVKQCSADVLRFSNRCATIFRSQFYFMTFNLSYEF